MCGIPANVWICDQCSGRVYEHPIGHFRAQPCRNPLCNTILVQWMARSHTCGRYELLPPGNGRPATHDPDESTNYTHAERHQLGRRNTEPDPPSPTRGLPRTISRVHLPRGPCPSNGIRSGPFTHGSTDDQLVQASSSRSPPVFYIPEGAEAGDIPIERLRREEIDRQVEEMQAAEDERLQRSCSNGV